MQDRLKALDELSKDLSKRRTYRSSSWVEAVFKGYSDILTDVQLPVKYNEGYSSLLSDIKETEVAFLKLKFASSTEEKDKIIEVIKCQLEVQMASLMKVLKPV